ncbi:MAG TPA: hypothetical protein VJ603_05750 [Paucimonas sp.]|nr:hypothetical protein [Paucimonas sp.]
MPALATLTARAKSASRQVFDDFSRTLPHEAWIADRFGLASRPAADSSPPIGIAAMRSHGLQPDTGVWFALQPVHIHIARDHLILTDTRQLALPEQESRALFDTAKPLFDEAGRELRYGDAHVWFVRADDWADLDTATPDAACGHNIDIWMPKGTGERAWRKLQNEVQMHWHTHAINAGREMRGVKPVNSLWLWGGAPASMAAAASPYAAVFNLPGWISALAPFAPAQFRDYAAAETIATAAAHGLVTLDTLIEPAFATDWHAWLERMHQLENDWFAPLLAGLKSGKLDQARLILTHGTGLAELSIHRRSLHKFWVKPSLQGLAP